MDTNQKNTNTSQHSHRWFIWTLVFLFVAGVSLVTYITVSGEQYSEHTWLTHRVKDASKK